MCELGLYIPFRVKSKESKAKFDREKKRVPAGKKIQELSMTNKVLSPSTDVIGIKSVLDSADKTVYWTGIIYTVYLLYNLETLYNTLTRSLLTSPTFLN